MGDFASLALEAGPKTVSYSAVLLACGVVVVRWVLLPRASRSSTDLLLAERRLGRLALVAGLALSAALVVRLFAHTAVAFGFSESLSSAEPLRTIALESAWGSGWRGQLGASLILLTGTLVFPFHRPMAWALIAFGALASIAALPLLGHGAERATRATLHVVHALGAGLWIGSLACAVLIRESREMLFRSFAPIALSGAAVMSVAGLLIAWQSLSSITDLWRTAYGQALTAKLVVVAAVAGCGFRNWRQWRQPAATESSSSRIAVVEMILAVVVVVITAWLTELEHPSAG